MPEELRPAIIRAVNTGPSSRTREIETSVPVWSTWPYCCNARDICNAITKPAKRPVRITMGRLPTPMRSICAMMSSP